MDDRVSVDDTLFTPLVRGLPSTAPFIGPEALERASGRKFLLRLGANESVFGPSPRAAEAMRDAVSQIKWYADPEAWETREAIAQYLGIGKEHIGLGAGIDDLLGQIVRLYLEPGSHVAASLGSYPTFGFHVAGFGGVIERAPYANDRNDLDALAEAARRTHASLVYLANPDNPSGSWLQGDEIARFLSALPQRCVLLLDEAYIEFAPREAYSQIDPSDTRVIRFRTFSKAYGMAGARIGYVIAAPETVRALDKIRLHFGVNTIAHAGAQASLADQPYLQSVVAEVARGRMEYVALAHDLGLRGLPSATNFVAIDVGSADRARATVAALANAGVFIRMAGAPPLDRCIRVSVGAADDRAAFARIFREIWPSIADS
ncbi:MAG TPA: aminotransferase class I/II-fold pyridoxal phosphate-dependent enzyme [Ktedonobacterales bacterium]|nr:aminotransferase class I/II-fold pyridoxal phosphate-dependent enzyme [Ktedonobacterales bacterium]